MDGIIELGGVAAVEMAASALAERGAPAPVCPNCNAPMIAAYCAICGQERDTHRHSTYRLVRDYVSDLLSFDSRILRTAWSLLARPGELSCAFREGRTQRYVPALRLYLFVSLFFFVALSFTEIALMQFSVVVTGNTKLDPAVNDYALKIGSNQKLSPETLASLRKAGVDVQAPKSASLMPPAVTGDVVFFAPKGSVQSRLPPDALAAIEKMRAKATPKESGPFYNKFMSGIQHIAKDPAAINGPLTVWMPRVLFLLLPLFALILTLFYRRPKGAYFFVDHLVYSLNFFSTAFVILLIAAGAAQILPGTLVAWAVLVANGVYMYFAMRRFYGESWPRTTLKFAAIGLIYSALVLVPAVTAVLVMSVSES